MRVSRFAAPMVLSLSLAAAGPVASAQAPFPAEELVARRARVMARIGDSAVAILQGAPPVRGFEVFRQNNEFYYLTGLAVPGAYVAIDGTARRTRLYLPKRDPRLERVEGPILSAEDVDTLRMLTGADEVHPVDSITSHLAGARARVIYTPFAPGEGRYQSRGEIEAANRRQAVDQWDGVPSREARFTSLLRTRLPRVDVRDLTPILDPLRVIKSPREVALLRRAGQLAALGTIAAMRSAEPGVCEYRLDAAARYQFWVNGAMGEGYRPITATGANAAIMHYYQSDTRLRDGELVLMDFAPEVGYYTSDMGRMFPVNGTYTPRQRELYGFAVEMHKAVLRHLRPGVTGDQVLAAAWADMEKVFAAWTFSKPVYRQAARNLLSFRGSLSHGVGMAVHDVGRYRDGPLAPGMVFSVDPQMWVPEENLYIRIEDTVVITETGVENLTGEAPIELDDVERLMRDRGIVQHFPPTPWAGASVPVNAGSRLGTTDCRRAG